jgi:hypothetical protein
MNATIPVFKDVWMRARKARTVIQCAVLMADDTVQVVRFGPRGGWRVVGGNADVEADNTKNSAQRNFPS